MSQLVWAGKGAEEESFAFFKTHSEFPQVSNFNTTLVPNTAIPIAKY